MVWIDAHPDITLPDDKTYYGYHAMAVTAIMGRGNKKLVSELPAQISADKILFVGIRDWERQEIKDRQQEYGIKHLTPDEVKIDSIGTDLRRSAEDMLAASNKLLQASVFDDAMSDMKKANEILVSTYNI